jgi:tricarballylate dehydrogenase
VGNRTVVVIGGGNAALCAAIAARLAGADVTLLERAPEPLSGGNSRFTAGAMRTVHAGKADLARLMPDVSAAEWSKIEVDPYLRGDFLDDLGRVTQYRTDPWLAETLVDRSYETLDWMRAQGVRFLPLYGRQSFEVAGRIRFWGGLVVEAWGGGPGLVQSLTSRATRLGIDIRYRHRAIALHGTTGGVDGVTVDSGAGRQLIPAEGVVLACGGFEANAAWRAQYLGPGWDLARVRGTRFNTGDGIRMAAEIGAATRGHFSGCHAVQWDANAPEYGDLAVGDGFQKHSYPFGILVNTRGERFVDEGADFRNYTYARYGQEVLRQPAQMAWQVFDGKCERLLRDEYHIRQVSKASGDSLEALARQMEGINVERFLDTVARFNAAVMDDVPFDPTVRDGRGTRGLPLPKSNWALRLDTPPFTAYAVGCGITFTFGGLHVDASARVLAQDGEPIPGLYAAGELVGGLFYFNYPGGTGLTSGAVYGRLAGEAAAFS